MRRVLFAAAAFVLSAHAVFLTAGVLFAAPFTAGNLAIYRVGDGASTLVATGSPVFIDEYSPAGALVQSLALPTTVGGGNAQLIASGTATSEGLITRSPDGKWLALTGYASNLGGTTNLADATASAIPRVVGLVDALATINTTTALTDFSSGNNPRSAVTTNGSDLWVAGGSGGVRYTTAGSTSSAQLSPTLANLRQLGIFGGQLYAGTNSGSSIRLGTVGTGLPTTPGGTIVNLPGFPASGNPFGFYFADLSAGIAGLDTLYVADEGGAALSKYSLVGGNWTLNGTVGDGGDDYRGLTALSQGNSVTLFATRGGNQLLSLIDSTGYIGAFAGTPTLLATAPANTVFRGVALTPVPEPSTLALIAIAACALFFLRRRLTM